MSVAAMNRLIVARGSESRFGSNLASKKPAQRADATDPDAAAAAEKARAEAAARKLADAQVTTVLDKALAFVPTEVITFWTAALGILKPTSTGARWALFLGGALGLVVLVQLDGKIRDKKVSASARSTGRARTRKAMVLASTSFALYAFASPASPGLSWNENTTRVAGLAAILFTAILYRLATYWDLVPAGND